MGYSSLISYIQSRVYENDSQAISGTGLQEALLQMVASLGDGYQFKGVATPATNPGTPDQNVFYIASEVGTYSNFGLSVGENEVAVFLWNGTWSKQSTGAASAEAVNQLGQLVIKDYIFTTSVGAYGSDLGYVASSNFNKAIIDTQDLPAGIKELYIYSAPRSDGYVSLVGNDNTILWQSNDADDFPKKLTSNDLQSVRYIYISNDIRLLESPEIKYFSSIDDLYLVLSRTSNSVSIKLKSGQIDDALSEIIIPAANKESAGIMSSEDKESLIASIDIPLSSSLSVGFYDANLAPGGSINFERTIVNLDDFSLLLLNAAPRSDAYCSLTDANDNILWQSNNVADFPKAISISDYPTAKRLYISNEKSVISVPTLKQIMPISERVSDIDNRVKALEEVNESFSLNIVSRGTNNYIPDSSFELPEDFGGFNIPVSITKDGGLIGWRIGAIFKNNSDISTYYISPGGNDSNDGLTREHPLKTIDAALSKSDVNTIILMEGVYHNGENFTNGISINKEINIIGEGRVFVKNGNSQSPWNITSAVYLYNIVFSGGISALNTTLSSQLCIFERCAFIGAASANGLTALGGKYILIECEASNNARDGFNYHTTTVGGVDYHIHALEIKCQGYNNGLTHNTDINNGSTMHNGGKIIRIYCNYGMSKGAVVADADGAKSLNLNVTAFSTQNLDGADGKRACFGSQGTGSKMWLYDCEAFGSKYDISVEAGSIIYTNISYQKEYVEDGGQIINLNP